MDFVIDAACFFVAHWVQTPSLRCVLGGPHEEHLISPCSVQPLDRLIEDVIKYHICEFGGIRYMLDKDGFVLVLVCMFMRVIQVIYL